MTEEPFHAFAFDGVLGLGCASEYVAMASNLIAMCHVFDVHQLFSLNPELLS